MGSKAKLYSKTFLVVLFLLNSHVGYAQLRTIRTELIAFNTEQTIEESNRKQKSFLQRIKSAIQGLKDKQKSFKETFRRNQQGIKNSRAKAKEAQALMKRQQREVRAKLRESQAQQQDQMRRLRDMQQR